MTTRVFVEIDPAFRGRIEELVESLIDILDQMAPDPEIEDGDEPEPP